MRNPFSVPSNWESCMITDESKSSELTRERIDWVAQEAFADVTNLNGGFMLTPIENRHAQIANENLQSALYELAQEVRIKILWR